MTYSNYDKVVNEINRLYAAGYNSDYPPLKKLLKEYEDFQAREERLCRLNEVRCAD